MVLFGFILVLVLTQVTYVVIRKLFMSKVDHASEEYGMSIMDRFGKKAGLWLACLVAWGMLFGAVCAEKEKTNSTTSSLKPVTILAKRM